MPPFQMRKCKPHFMYLAVAGARMLHILKVFVLTVVLLLSLEHLSMGIILWTASHRM